VCEDDDVTLDSVGVGLGLHAGDLTCESLVHDYGGAEMCFAEDSDLALPENAAWLGGREYYPGIFAMELCCSTCSSVDWYDDGDYAFDHGDYAFDHVDGVDGASECDVCPAGTHANALGTECVECTVGTYSSTAGAASCAVCEEGTVSAPPPFAPLSLPPLPLSHLSPR
jgi:hypothetical protein